MAREQVIDKIANDRVGFVAELCDDPADEGSAACMPLQIDRARNVPGAVYLCPTVRTSGLFGPNFDETKFPLQLRITHNLGAQRFATGRDYLNNRLHSMLRFSRKSVLLQCFFSRSAATANRQPATET
jgi:hypothetical protein